MIEQEGFEEPGCVREVPPGRTHVWRCLQTVIVRRERFAQRLAHAPYGDVAICQGFPGCGGSIRGGFRLWPAAMGTHAAPPCVTSWH